MGFRWMVDCNGTTGEAGQESVDRVFHDMDLADFIDKQGSLAATVRGFIQKRGYTITDSGGGVGCWHLGVPFDDLQDACVYLELLTTVFAKAIAAGLLRFALKTWSTSSWKL